MKMSCLRDTGVLQMSNDLFEERWNPVDLFERA